MYRVFQHFIKSWLSKEWWKNHKENRKPNSCSHKTNWTWVKKVLLLKKREANSGPVRLCRRPRSVQQPAWTLLNSVAISPAMTSKLLAMNLSKNRSRRTLTLSKPCSSPQSTAVQNWWNDFWIRLSRLPSKGARQASFPSRYKWWTTFSTRAQT